MLSNVNTRHKRVKMILKYKSLKRYKTRKSKNEKANSARKILRNISDQKWKFLALSVLSSTIKITVNGSVNVRDCVNNVYFKIINMLTMITIIWLDFCKFMFVKIHKMVMKGINIESNFFNLQHTYSLTQGLIFNNSWNKCLTFYLICFICYIWISYISEVSRNVLEFLTPFSSLFRQWIKKYSWVSSICY